MIRTSTGPIREITIRGLIIGTILTIILAAANAYLGLKVGQTISASIPAAIISMSILRFYRDSSVLENTMVQTMASVGEALVAGVAYILPAFIILHAWDHFPYWQTVTISLLGGILGVLFTIPLRRALLQEKTLRFPEGVAITNVLKASAAKETQDLKGLTLGGIIGAGLSFCQAGLQILTDSFQYWTKLSQTTVVGFGLGLSPALIAAGYIVGVSVAISLLIGSIIGWLIAVPVVTGYYGIPAELNQASDIAMHLWRTHIRYIGVGTMLVGGLWTLVTLVRPIVSSIYSSIKALSEIKLSGYTNQPSTERDIPINYVFWMCLLLLVPIFLLIFLSIIPAGSALSPSFHLFISAFSTLYILVGGFVFCSVTAYFAGLVGSTNNPVSGMLVSSLLLLCLCVLAFFNLNGGMLGKESLGIMIAIGSTVIIGGALAIANDTMQDLKVGHQLGATPWKQQVMLILGVIVASIIIPPILDLLYKAYGIGGVFPHPNMDKTQMLSAPQAGLMAAVTQGIYTHHFEWNMFLIGAVIAFIAIVCDEFLKTRGKRLPVLAVGLGIYLPLDSSMPVIIGGILSFIIQKRLDQFNRKPTVSEEAIIACKHRGLLIACGIVAGASVMGVLLAIPFAIAERTDVLRIMPLQLEPIAGLLSLIVTFFLCIWLYKVVTRV